MAQTSYRRPTPGSLQDLLAQEQLASGPAVPTPDIPQAPSIDTEGLLTPQQRQSLIDVLFQPEEPGPAPTVDKPSALAMLFSGLGDATAAFAAGKSGNPAFATDYFGDYQRRLNRQKADLQEYEDRLAKSRTKSKERKAEFLLREDEQSRAAKEAALLKTEMQAAALAQKKEAIDFREQEAEKNRQFQAQQQEERLAAQKEAAADRKFQVDLANLSRAHENTDKDAAKRGELEQKGFATGAGLTGVILRDGNEKAGLKSARQQIIEGGDINTVLQQARERFEESLNEEGIFGRARDLAREYFNRKALELYRNPPPVAAQ